MLLPEVNVQPSLLTQIGLDNNSRRKKKKKTLLMEIAKTSEISKTSVRNIPWIKHCINFSINMPIVVQNIS